MAKWTDMGHAMRRRMGAPSNHFEAAGTSMARTHQTAEEAYDMAKSKDSSRIAMGDQDPLDILSAEQNAPENSTLVAKKSTQSQDPTGYGAGAPRQNILQERLGAGYSVVAETSPTIDPAAGATMANARIIPSVLGRQNPNFMGAVQDSSL
jgi:hypothetical protein